MSNRPLDQARSKMEQLSTELSAITSLHGDDESTWPPGILERSNRLVRGLEKATETYDALSARGDRIEAIRQAAMDPRNIEAGPRAVTACISVPRARGTGSTPVAASAAWTVTTVCVHAR